MVRRVAAVLSLVGGVVVLIALPAAGYSPGVSPFKYLGSLGEIFGFIFACIYAAVFWAARDLITIALRLEATLPAGPQPL